MNNARTRIAALITTVGALSAPLTAAIITRAVEQASVRVNEPQLRQVFLDDAGFPADVSADGRLAVMFTRPYGRGTLEAPARLEIRNLLTKKTTVLSGGPSPAGTPGRPAAAFSPDAQQVVYSWLDTKLTGTGMLQVIGVTDGATPRTLIAADPSDIGIVPHGWSPDGKSILVLIHGPSERFLLDPTSLAWVSASDGAMRTIKQLEPWRRGGSALPRLSRDGKWIAFSAVSREGSTDRHIYVTDANGQTERAVATVAGSNTNPVWTPDGSHVVFVNNSQDGSELLAVRVADGNPTGAPVRLSGFNGEPLRITDSGALYYFQYSGGLTGFIAEPAPTGGRMLQPFSGYGAAWSGNSAVVFVRGDRQIVVRSLDSGEERAFSREAIPIFPPQLLNDGTAAIFYVFPGGDDGRPGGSFYRVDLKTGAFNRLFGKDTATHRRSNVGVLSRDGRLLYLGVLADAPPRWSGIVGIDVATGAEQSVVPLPGGGIAVAGIAISPDGGRVALHAADGRILTMPLSGGEVREVCGPSPGGGWRDVIRWSSDGEHIIFARRPSATSTSWQLMRVAAIGGQPAPYGLESSTFPRPGALTSFDLDANGSRIAVSLRTPPAFTVTAFENIMSSLTGKAR